MLAEVLRQWEARQRKVEVLMIDFAKPKQPSYERTFERETLQWCRRCMKMCSGPHPEPARREE